MGLLIGNVLRHAARAAPDRLAASLGDDEVAFGALDAASNRTGHALAGLGIGYGERVAWWADTSLDALPVFFALARLGAVFAPVNARLGADEAGVVVEYARPSLLIVDEAHVDAAGELDVPTISHSDLFERAVTARASDVVCDQLDEGDAHVIFFTSGSTGRPKGVVLSHRANVLRSYPALAADTDGGTVCMFPLFHMAGWSLALGCWQSRRPIHFVHRPDAETLLRVTERRHAARIYLIPGVWARVLDDIGRYDLSELREADTGTSATPPELVAAVREALPHTVTRIFYGSTEAGAGTVLAHRDLARKPGSVGLPQPGVDVRLSETGEVCLRSELLFDGYFDAPEATAEALHDGWYHTGDLGVIDDEGYLSIVGRARDVIRTGGEAVVPAEVEAVLGACPGVRDVAVVGLPDARWGEIVCAVVVPAPGAANGLDVDDLRAWCEGRLAPFKRPRRVVLADELPCTAATGQVQRTLLVERIGASADGTAAP